MPTPEVIVSAGAVASPQLLEVSGIGQPERLNALGIPVVHELAGVGENLRDHYAPRMKWRVPAKGLTYNDRARGLGLVWQALKFAGAQSGLLSLPASPVRAYIRHPAGPRQPRRHDVVPFPSSPPRISSWRRNRG